MVTENSSSAGMVSHTRRNSFRSFLSFVGSIGSRERERKIEMQLDAFFIALSRPTSNRKKERTNESTVNQAMILFYFIPSLTHTNSHHHYRMGWDSVTV